MSRLRGFATIDWSSAGLGCVLLGIALAGMAHLRVGEWRPAPGGGSWLVPLLAYLTIIPAAVTILHAALKSGLARQAEALPGLLPVLATALWSLVFFQGVRHLGLVSGTCGAMVTAMLLLAPRRREALRIVVPVAIAVSLAFWLLFTRVAPIIVERPVLF
ncbi:hypothetical protein BH23ACI1_BH23ACI1_06130 [soil metagenome]